MSGVFLLSWKDDQCDVRHLASYILEAASTT